MKSTSESSFGARLRKAQDIYQYIRNYQGYAPPRVEETLPSFEAFLKEVSALNTQEIQANQDYYKVISHRQQLFNKDANSLTRLLPLINAAVNAQYGKTSHQAKFIGNMIKVFRTSKTSKPTVEGEEATPANSVSNSERSFGSMTQYFKNIINTLEQFGDYNTSNTLITIPTLQQLVAQIDKLNDEAIKHSHALRSIKTNRRNIYKDLTARVQRIKSYIKSQYGSNSLEYASIKSLRV